MRLPLYLSIIVVGSAASFLLWGGSLAAEQSAHQAVCLARIKDLDAAIRNYAVDHDDTLPLAADRSRNPWKWWYQAIFPYSASVTSFYCPQLLEDQHVTLHRSRLLPVAWNLRLLSYGMAYPVDAFQQKHGSLRLEEISNPQEKIVLGESHAPILRNTKQFWAKDVAPRHAGWGNFITFSGEGLWAERLPDTIPSTSGSGVHDLTHWTLP